MEIKVICKECDYIGKVNVILEKGMQLMYGDGDEYFAGPLTGSLFCLQTRRFVTEKVQVSKIFRRKKEELIEKEERKPIFCPQCEHGSLIKYISFLAFQHKVKGRNKITN